MRLLGDFIQLQVCCSASRLGYFGQVVDCIAGILYLGVEVLHLIVGALKLRPAQAELISLRAVRYCLRCTALYEVSFAKECQSYHKLRLHQTIDVLAVDTVNSLPIDIYEARVAYDHIVVGKFQIDRNLF